MKTFKCPACGKQQTEIYQLQKCVKYFRIFLDTNDYKECEEDAGDICGYACSDCGEYLPDDLVEKIEKQIL